MYFLFYLFSSFLSSMCACVLMLHRSVFTAIYPPETSVRLVVSEIVGLLGIPLLRRDWGYVACSVMLGLTAPTYL
ncbi:hypothetical protein B0J12DRAFT_691395 [Macrophomina phaseolina]|uniref:Secreted protein n=1 Tax=Macrophomina phaseolina TaxID=35725 RepID=A0ABQ8FQH4_9PEZI|nr:hypothetical protein B0J12DRAFT_691395 [Macrophomina phaseolina]